MVLDEVTDDACVRKLCPYDPPYPLPCKQMHFITALASFASYGSTLTTYGHTLTIYSSTLATYGLSNNYSSTLTSYGSTLTS